ncbi:MAG: beta-phosphoglucomutase family hydrolase [Rhodothermia bacterium]|nr:beta-phosphoglucomutase family hydrolase [Rhodothermia bacterium]
MTKALIFDMDGTIVDNMAVHIEVWLALLAQNGVLQSASEFHRVSSGKTNPEILRYYLGSNLSDQAVQALGEEKEAMYRTIFADRIEAVNGLYSLLEEAQEQGLLLALATSAPPVNVPFVLNGLGLQHTFDAIVTANDVQNGKPHPEVFLKAAQKLQCIPEECVVFEDAPVGFLAAKHAGMSCIIVATSPFSAEDAALPHIKQVVRDFTEVNRLALYGC